MYVALSITHTFSRTTGGARWKPYVVRVWYNIHINACPQSGDDVVDDGSTIQARVPSVQILSSGCITQMVRSSSYTSNLSCLLTSDLLNIPRAYPYPISAHMNGIGDNPLLPTSGTH